MQKYSISIPTAVILLLLIGGAMGTAGEVKELENLKQPPLQTSMMGVIKGVSDYYGLELSTAMAYGLSGYAFLINMHVQLCPSSPYVWKRENMVPLLSNMGIKMTDLGFFGAKDSKDARAAIESKLREALDEGVPCSVLNMDDQIIYGYDEKGFLAIQPWGPENPVTPARLTFGTWEEFGEEVHVNLYKFEKTEPVDRKHAILASLDYAIDMHKNPEKHSSELYSVGPKAYDNWIKAVPEHGAEHGNWWNAVVWCECRYLASRYVTEIGKMYESVSDLCDQLKDEYLQIARNLRKISNKEMNSEEKINLLKETKQLDADAIKKLEKLATEMRANI